MADTQVRAAEPEDLPLLADVEAAADRVTESALGTTERFEEPSAGERRQREPGFLLVAGRPVVGFAQVLEQEGTAHLQQIAVRPERARHGIGTALLEAVCRESAARGHSELTLTTFRDVVFNRPWYERCGFEVVPEPTGVLARHLEQERTYERFGPRVGMVRRLAGVTHPRFARHQSPG